MKKSTISIIFLEILLIIVTVGYNNFGIGQPKNIEHVITNELKGNEKPSLNYILKYEMPNNYIEDLGLQGEIAIINNKNTAMFTGDIIMTEDLTTEDFLKQQTDLFSNLLDFSVVSEDTLELKDRTINKKVYKISNDFQTIFSFGATIEFKDKPSEFIGVLGNGVNSDSEKDLDLLLNSITYTNQTLDKEKIFSNDSESITVTMPPYWKKIKGEIPYNFYKKDGDNVVFSMISSGDKNYGDIHNEYDLAKESFLQDGVGTLIEDSKIDSLDDKTITTSIIKSPITDSTIFLILIEFNNSDIFTAVRYELSGDADINANKDDLDFIIKSIKLK